MRLATFSEFHRERQSYRHKAITLLLDMPLVAANQLQAAIIPDSQTPKAEKKHKKKRARDEDEFAVVEETPRKSKKSRSEEQLDGDAFSPIEQPRLANEEPKKKKKKKQRDHAVADAEPLVPAVESAKKKSKKHRLEAASSADTGFNDQDASVLPEVAVDVEPSASRKKSKKHKKHRERETDVGHELENDDLKEAPANEAHSKREKHKEKKSKKRKGELQLEQDPMEHEQPAAEPIPTPAVDAETQEKKMKRKHKDKSKEKSKEKRKRPVSPEASEHGGGELMELDAPQFSVKVTDLPADASFPFFTQTISLYVPFFPVGFDRPLTNIAAQHLEPLLNHYSPTLRGVLLSYSNLNLSDKPVRASRTNPPTDQTPALLHSVDEYAVGFGWLTFDAQLFVPARGKWMEGIVQLQSEGHIGVVCWNKFNASIEAKRLPKGWKWVDLAKNTAKNDGSSSLPSPDWDTEEPAQQQEEEDALDGEELQVVEQMHTTGYWVNERGRKVSGKLRFRIKNFDVGLAGDYGYLSIEGTSLDDDAERALAAEEREAEKRRWARQNPNGLVRPPSRRVPEFSMTKLGREDQEEGSGQRTVLYRGSRPGTPDD